MIRGSINRIQVILRQCKIGFIFCLFNPRSFVIFYNIAGLFSVGIYCLGNTHSFCVFTVTIALSYQNMVRLREKTK